MTTTIPTRVSNFEEELEGCWLAEVGTRFISEILGLAPTRYGLVERAFFEAELRAGVESIARCRRPQPEHLWQTRNVYGEDSPEIWVALKECTKCWKRSRPH